MTQRNLDDRPTVRVKSHSYQPLKVEKEEIVMIRNPDGSVPTPGELVRVALSPMNVVKDSGT